MNLGKFKFGASTAAHVLFFMGICGFVYGCWLVWHPLGWLTGGAALILLSMMIDREDNSGRG
jgi:hypothetical protein